MTMQIVKISGLTCVACTKLTAKRLKTIDGVEEAVVDLETGHTSITATRSIAINELQAVLNGKHHVEEYYE